MIYIVTIYILTMQVGSQFPNIINKEKKKMCGACVSFKKKCIHVLLDLKNFIGKMYFISKLP